MLTSHVLMVRPVAFGYNAETAVNNAFQQASGGDTQVAALKEFDAFVEKLRNQNIEVTVLNDTLEPHTPDSIFPNNWVSFHTGGEVCLYPMFAVNRREERKAFDAVKSIYEIKKLVDFIHYEKENKFLEGTGSMVLDRGNALTYACLSPRTDEKVLDDFCQKMNYSPVVFRAVDANGQDIYHTNVMMCMGEKYVVICLESIVLQDREKVVEVLQKTKKEIIAISLEQMAQFAGNMLQVKNRDGKPFLVMSETAYKSLTPEQISAIQNHNEIIAPDIPIIEQNGGGSARCMLAEVFV